MSSFLKIAFLASECAPFAKTGGLADVVGALPAYLKKLGHELIVILPKYSSIDTRKFGLRRYFDSMGVWMGTTLEWCAVDIAVTANDVPVFFIEFDKYFNRNGVYHDPDFNDFTDNPLRFSFFTRAALQLCKDLHFSPDIIHAHDWQTALAPAYLKIWHWNDPVLGKAASLLTIHNMCYQGVYGRQFYDYTGLQWRNFTSEKFEDHGRMNFLKGGIYYSDLINTVSPNYARETRTAELGYGMAPYLNRRGDDYFGILNGVDYSEWNPSIDPLIPANYSPSDLKGKSVCKRELQHMMGLDEDEGIALIGVVSRFASQKGLDLLAAVIEPVVRNMHVQFAVLGSGDPDLESFYGNLPQRMPGRVGSFIGYNNELAHWIEAGADFFVMPSIYEPCGLNQIYSLKYGTLPVVRATGGLDDTVEQYNEWSGEGTGFKFNDPTPDALYYTIGWAVSTFFDRRNHYVKMQQSAMNQNYSWDESTRNYEAAYHRAIWNKFNR